MKIRSLFLLSLVVSPFVAANAERVLIPIAYHGHGRFGSYWATGITAWNTGDRPLSVAGVKFIVSSSCGIPEGCLVDELPVGETGDVVTANWNYIQAPHGLLLSLPDDEDGRPVLLTRLYWDPHWDDWADLPVPLEREFRSTLLRFPLVPLEGSTRTTLRIYALDLHSPLSLRVFAEPAGGYGGTVEKTIILQPSTSPERYPSYGELALANAGGGPYNITVGPEEDQTLQAKVWAFISITRNDSNAVKIMTPR